MPLSRMNHTLIPCLVISLACVSPGQAQSTQPDRGDLDAAIAMLRDASIRMDSAGIQFVRDRFTSFLEDEALVAEVQYQMGFADIASLFSPTMSNRTAGPEETTRRLNRAIESLLQSAERDDGRLETWCLLALAERLNSTVLTGDEQQAMMDASDRHLARAESLDAEHPEVLTAGAMIKLFGGDTAAVTRLEQAVTRYRQTMTGDRKVDAGWWPLIARGMLARMDQFSGQTVRGLRLVNECLALEPDYPMAAMMKPRLEAAAAAAGDGYKAMDRDHLPGASWIVLSEDASDDGRDNALADGKTFSYWSDAAASKVWFRFDLHQNLNAEAFGVNVIVDADADQSTGANWWGTNAAFTWERLVTVWVSKESNGKYSGTVGVGDLAGLNQGDFAGLHRGGIDFVVLEDESAIVIGLPRQYLSDGDSINIVGAVGSNTLWNDDLQDEGYATIDLR